jgi:hypothetical protein
VSLRRWSSTAGCLQRLFDHLTDRCWLRHVGCRERHPHLEIGSDLRLRIGNVFRLAEAVEEDSEPAAAKARAMPNPIPLVDPVTSDTLPESAPVLTIFSSLTQCSWHVLPFLRRMSQPANLPEQAMRLQCVLANELIHSRYGIRSSAFRAASDVPKLLIP